MSSFVKAKCCKTVSFVCFLLTYCIGCYDLTQGAFVVDRLSILHISAVQRLTGATILSTFSMEIPETSFGKVEKVKHVVLNDKRSVCLRDVQPLF